MQKIQNKIEILSNEDLFNLIDPNTEIVVIAPWNSKPIPITIRMLDSVSLTSCGDFNTVSSVISEDKDEKVEFDIETVIKAKNIHENMLRLAMVHPTFDELNNHLINKDYYKQAKEEAENIKKLIRILDIL